MELGKQTKVEKPRPDIDRIGNVNNRNRLSAKCSCHPWHVPGHHSGRRESSRQAAARRANPGRQTRKRTQGPANRQRLERSNKPIPKATACRSETRHPDLNKPNPAAVLLIPEAGEQASQHQSHHQDPKRRHRKPVVFRCGAKVPSVGISTAGPATPCMLPEKPRTSCK
jgi:hypothetical protein